MPRPFASAITLAILLLLSSSSRAGDVLEEAKSLLAANDPAAAVDRLERALPDAGKDQLKPVFALLRVAYESAAKKADSEGRIREARHYREGLKLLPSSEPVAPAAEPKPEPEPLQPAETLPSAKPAESDVTEPADPPAASLVGDELHRADELWKAKKYIEAGNLYATLAKANHLPPTRRDHWAYCRLVAVLERINNGPSSPAEWAEIHAEVDHIRVLSPKNWYGEYLRNVVIERSGGARRGNRDSLVVRGSAPEEPPPKAKPSRPRLTSPAAVRSDPPKVANDASPPPEAKPAPVSPEAAIGRPGAPQGNWQTFVTPNFRIFHNDEALARKVAVKAEATRRSAAKRWTGIEPAVNWTPRCDLYLYPTAAIFAAQTQQPAESPGFSTAGLENGRVTARMVKLRVDYPKMFDAVLPHEVTHIVLADLFPMKQIPRWADEGMSALSEPAEELALRVRDLSGPVRDGVLFRLEVLMTADYPSGNHWALYYAQSVSLTNYLVGLGTPPQFVRFVRASQVQGIDQALRTVYQIDSVAQLESGWKSYAQKTHSEAAVAASEESKQIRK